MNIVLTVPFALDREKIQTQLAIRAGTRFEDDFLRLLDRVGEIARPKALYRLSYVDTQGPEQVILEKTTFHSKALRANLENIGRVFPYIVTCGREVDELLVETDDTLLQYWMSIIKLFLLQNSVEFLRQTIHDQYKIDNLSSMNPGSGEASIWPIEEQRFLFSLFGGVQVVEQTIGVRLLPSFMMTPDMSASGILFPSETTYFNCQLCQREACPSRQAPFDNVLWEAVHRKS